MGGPWFETRAARAPHHEGRESAASCRVGFIQASSIVLAARIAPEFSGVWPPPRKRRGGRRAKGRIQSFCSRDLSARVAPLGAPSGVSFGAGTALSAPLRRAFGSSLRQPFTGEAAPTDSGGPRGPPSASSSRGARSGPGRSPGAARVRALRSHARGRRPDPHERRNRFASPHGDRARWNIVLDYGGIMS